jgi:hypothetical protein
MNLGGGMWKWLCPNLRFCPGMCQEGLRNTIMYVRIVSVLAGLSSPEHMWGSCIAILLSKAVIVCNVMFVFIGNGCLLIQHWAVNHHKLLFIYRAFLENTTKLCNFYLPFRNRHCMIHTCFNASVRHSLQRCESLATLPGLLFTAWDFTMCCVAWLEEKYYVYRMVLCFWRYISA